MLMYPDPPMARKPATRADEAEFTVNDASERKSKKDSAILALRALGLFSLLRFAESRSLFVLLAWP